VQALGSLVGNEAVQLEPYLHQIMPFILTCMVGKRLGVSPPCIRLNKNDDDDNNNDNNK